MTRTSSSAPRLRHHAPLGHSLRRGREPRVSYHRSVGSRRRWLWTSAFHRPGRVEPHAAPQLPDRSSSDLQFQSHSARTRSRSRAQLRFRCFRRAFSPAEGRFGRLCVHRAGDQMASPPILPSNHQIQTPLFSPRGHLRSDQGTTANLQRPLGRVEGLQACSVARQKKALPAGSGSHRGRLKRRG